MRWVLVFLFLTVGVLCAEESTTIDDLNSMTAFELSVYTYEQDIGGVMVLLDNGFKRIQWPENKDLICHILRSEIDPYLNVLQNSLTAYQSLLVRAQRRPLEYTADTAYIKQIYAERVESTRVAMQVYSQEQFVINKCTP